MAVVNRKTTVELWNNFRRRCLLMMITYRSVVRVEVGVHSR